METMRQKTALRPVVDFLNFLRGMETHVGKDSAVPIEGLPKLP